MLLTIKETLVNTETAVKFSCQDVRGQLASYTQGTLSLPRAQQVYSHLIRCRVCRILADQNREFRSRSLTLSTGLLATIGAVLLALGGMTLPSSPMAAPGGPSLKTTPSSINQFVSQPGAAYYVRLHVADLPAAEDALTRILTEAPVLRAKGPYAARYYLIATPEQMTALVRRLRGMGDAGAVTVGSRRIWRGDPTDPDACSAMLDLLCA